uniref:Uncharacterized protein n=1 Tax=Sciurus vulgaris TaxID=55149 RepID=A0A8D2CZ71_SCIVU
MVMAEGMAVTLAVQQYIQQNIRADCSNIDKILEPPEGQNEVSSSINILKIR